MNWSFSHNVNALLYSAQFFLLRSLVWWKQLSQFLLDWHLNYIPYLLHSFPCTLHSLLNSVIFFFLNLNRLVRVSPYLDSHPMDCGSNVNSYNQSFYNAITSTLPYRNCHLLKTLICDLGSDLLWLQGGLLHTFYGMVFSGCSSSLFSVSPTLYLVRSTFLIFQPERQASNTPAQLHICYYWLNIQGQLARGERQKKLSFSPCFPCQSQRKELSSFRAFCVCQQLMPSLPFCFPKCWELELSRDSKQSRKKWTKHNETENTEFLQFLCP